MDVMRNLNFFYIIIFSLIIFGFKNDSRLFFDTNNINSDGFELYYYVLNIHDYWPMPHKKYEHKKILGISTNYKIRIDGEIEENRDTVKYKISSETGLISQVGKINESPYELYEYEKNKIKIKRYSNTRLVHINTIELMGRTLIENYDEGDYVRELKFNQSGKPFLLTEKTEYGEYYRLIEFQDNGNLIVFGDTTGTAGKPTSILTYGDTTLIKHSDSVGSYKKFFLNGNLIKAIVVTPVSKPLFLKSEKNIYKADSIIINYQYFK